MKTVLRLIDIDEEIDEMDGYAMPTDLEWRAHFTFLAKARCRYLGMRKKLTIDELMQAQRDAMDEAFVYFMGLTPAQQERCRKQFVEGLAEIEAAQERNMALARRELERRGWRDGC